MTMAKVSLLSTTMQSNCVVSVRATELSERKLQLDFKTSPELENDDGEHFEEGTIRYLCGEGLAHARRRLGLAGGLSLDIYELKGTIRKGAEVGISYAVAMAIAKSLNKSGGQPLLGDTEHWEVVTN
jgi:hypothetical protein